MEWLIWIGGGAAAVGSIMRWVVTPTARAVRRTVQLCDAIPVIQNIADEFKPNGGLSLVDQIQEMNRKIDDNADSIAEVKNLLEVHIASVLPGGRRFSDP